MEHPAHSCPASRIAESGVPPWGRRLLVAFVLVVCTLGVLAQDAAVAHAQGVNAEPWRTIHTTHFRVHYHPGTEAIAEEVAAMCELAHELLTVVLDTRPFDVVDVALFDEVDSANGSAGVIPRSLMRLQAMPPEATGSLGYVDNWMWNLIVHEYTHILQIGMIGAFGRIINLVGGMRVAPAQQLPRWIIEGIATYLESKHTGTGRVNSPYFRSLLRASALDGTIPDPSGLSGVPITWPQATGWYLYGSFFFDWLERRYGWDAISLFFHEYARRAIPFGVNVVATRAFGRTMDDLYADWKQETEQHFAAEDRQRRAWGVAADRPLSPERNQTRFVAADRSGERVGWVVNDGFDGPELVVHRSDRVDRIAIETDGEFDFVPDAEAVIVSQFNTVHLAYAFRDLFRLDYRTGDVTRLTYSGRAGEPRVSADGSQVVFVSPWQGRTDLHVLDLATLEVRVLAEAPAWGQYARPSFSADGSTVIASLLVPGRGRGLVKVDVATGEVTNLPQPGGWAYDPVLHPNGREVVYLGDRSGMLEPWAYDLESGRARRLARLANGALSPAIAMRDGRPVLVASLVNGEGFGIHEIVAQWGHGVPLAAEEGRAPTTPPGTIMLPDLTPPAVEPLLVGAQTTRYASGRYLAPLQWTPSFSSATGQTLAGVTMNGIDPVGKHIWRALLQWNLDAEAPMGLVEYTTTTFPWTLSTVVARTFDRRDQAWIGESRFLPFWQDRWTVSAGTTFPFPRLGSTHRLGVSGAWQSTSPLIAPRPRHGPWDVAPVEPTFGPATSWAVSWNWGDAAGGVYAVGPFWGRGLSLTTRITTPALGGAIERGELAWSARRWVPIPWVRSHVLAMRYMGGLGATAGANASVYAIGGPQPQDLIQALSELIPAPTANIRGFPEAIRRGDRYHLVNVEYRMPLLVVDGGVSTLPAFVRRFTWAAFLDAGDAWNGRIRLQDTLVGAGLELRMESALGYVLPADFRIGAGRGLGPEGVWAWWFFYGYPF